MLYAVLCALHPLPFVVDAVVSLLLSLFFFNATYHQSKSQENALIRAVKLWKKKKNDDGDDEEKKFSMLREKRASNLHTAIKI